MSAEPCRLFSASSSYEPIERGAAREVECFFGLTEQVGLFEGSDGRLWLVRSTSPLEFRAVYNQLPSLCSGLPGFPWRSLLELPELPYSIVQAEQRQRWRGE
jgi:hypothetical protein